jgi:SAM-dependent methyltransferase
LSPISRNFGMNRGQPIDRYYIENFLSRHAEDIAGHVLEIRDSTYTRRFGGDRISVSDVLDVDGDNPRATIVGDLTDAGHIPSDTFDCIIFTQTLHFIYDVHAAAMTLCRILKPGGVLLATFPGISQTSCAEHGEYYCWALSRVSARRLFEETFPVNNIEVNAYGNVLAAIAFLHGLASEELRYEELDNHKPDYEVSITVRAIKPHNTSV